VLAGDTVSLAALSGQFADKNVGTNKGITLASSSLGGADGANYSISNSLSVTANITPKVISVTGVTASDKVYDGTTAATLVGGALTGFIPGDAVSLAGQSASFSDKNVGTGKTVTFNGGSLTGADASNYQLTGTLSGTVTANITPLAITVSGITASNKAYDRTTTATLSVSTAVLHGVLGSDVVSIDASGVSGNFENKNAGINKSVVLSGLVLSGADAANYSANNASSVTATITPLSVTITGATAQDKVYDGTLNAVVSGGSVTGVLSGDVVSLSGLTGQFANKNVGTGKSVTLANATLGGADGGNYTITSSNPVTASITPKSITAGSVAVSDKVYDGTATATVNSGTLGGVVTGDQVSLTGLTGLFMDSSLNANDAANAGTNKSVTISGGSLTGADAYNYQLSGSVSGTGTASITPRPVVISGKTIVVTADQLSTVVPAWSQTGLVGTDAVTGVVVSPVDVTATAGTVQVLTPTGATINPGLASNYTLSYTPGYVVVLPTEASALAGDTGAKQNVFFLQLNADELKAAAQALDQQRPTLPAARQGPTGPDDLRTVANNPTETPANTNVGRQAAEYLNEIKESTRAVIEQMRTKPLLLWDEKSPEKFINLSDSGVRN